MYVYIYIYIYIYIYVYICVYIHTAGSPDNHKVQFREMADEHPDADSGNNNDNNNNNNNNNNDNNNIMDVQTYPKRFLPEPFEAY